jgi:hypothetical protein
MPRPPELTTEIEGNHPKRQAWKLDLFEWCCLMGDVEDLIREVEEGDASLALPFNGADNRSH